jgi:hypothetical protein
MAFERPWRWLLTVLVLCSCSNSEDGNDEVGSACVGGLFCPGDQVCVDGFCVAGVGETSSSGDGDGDPTTGDGDGDPTTGDGDGDGDGDPTTGDGDGDGDGDPTTGDGDGDPTTGDGDGDSFTCTNLATSRAQCSIANQNGCVCYGCPNPNGICENNEDCVCPDCTNESFCGGSNCENDGLCDPYFEGCSCADCAGHPAC